MSTTPLNLSNFSPKSFFSRPEGKWFGIPVLLALAAVGIYGFFQALPFLLISFTNMIYLGVLGAVLIGMIMLALNPTVQCVVKNMFQSFCRGVAGILVTIDPIGILKNNLDDMKKGKEKLSATIRRMAGSDSKLLRKISDRKEAIKQLMAEAQSAERMAAAAKTQLDADRFKMKTTTNQQKAGFLMSGVDQLSQLEVQTKSLLDKFRRWEVATDAKIERTDFQVSYWSDQRETILDAQKALKFADRILKGDPEQLKLVNSAIEFMADDAARTVGEIEDFNRFSEKMLTDFDVENDANATRAKEKFTEFGAKLDADASRPTAADALQAAINAAPSPTLPNSPILGRGVGVGANGTTGSDYNDLFNK